MLFAPLIFTAYIPSIPHHSLVLLIGYNEKILDIMKDSFVGIPVTLDYMWKLQVLLGIIFSL